MSVGVVADGVALGVFTAKNTGRLGSFFADDEKRRWDTFFLEDVEDFGSPARVGAVVKRDGKLLRHRAELVNFVGKRELVVGFVSDQVGGLVVGEGANTALGLVVDTPDVAVAFENEVGTGRNVFQFVANGVIGTRSVPDLPERTVGRA